MTMAHTALRLPVAGSVIIPSRPKSASATSPGGVSAIRTVVLLGRRQFRFSPCLSDWECGLPFLHHVGPILRSDLSASS